MSITVEKPFPFDLENLFSLQYSFETLKKAIEYLANEQMMMKSEIRGQKEKQDV